MEERPGSFVTKDLTCEASYPPEGFVKIADLAQLLSVRSLLSESPSREGQLISAMAQMQKLARCLYSDPDMVVHLFGHLVESLQLRPLEAGCRPTACSPAFVSEARPLILTVENRDLFRNSLALEAWNVPREIATAESRLAGRSEDPSVDDIGLTFGRAFTMHAATDAYDTLLLYDDSWNWTHDEMSARLDYDPEELNFNEKVRWIGAFDLWRAAASYRIIEDSRVIGGLFLDQLESVRTTGSCAALPTTGGLSPLVEVESAEGGSGCSIQYLPEGTYRRFISKGKGVNPLFRSQVSPRRERE